MSSYKGVSFQEAELRLAKDEAQEKFEVKQILGKKTEKKIVYYLVWWYGEKKKEASWEPRTNIIKFVPDLIQEFDDLVKKKLPNKNGK